MKTSLKQLRVMLLLLGFAFVASACLPFVGDGDDEGTPTPAEIPTVIRPTQVASDPPTASPVPTLQPLPTQAPQTTSPPPACTPRNDWPVYTIQAGDTLYSIALRSETTVDTLVAANCLGDANVIREGQELRVPKQPAPSEATASPAPAATQQPFFSGTPTTGQAADVEFVFVVAENSADVTAERTYRARNSSDPVSLSIVAINATNYKVIRGDGREMKTVLAQQGTGRAGETISFAKTDTIAGQQSLIFTIRATTQDGSTVESAAVTIQWP